MSSYKYIPASQGALTEKIVTPKAEYTEFFQQTLNEQFYNASNWWTIEEETASGSEEYLNVDVRIAHVINTETGLKLGDDWKTVLFKDVSHPVDLGKHYKFDGSTWLTINTEILKNLTGTCTIRRCNNTLRWIDESTGIYYEEPCCIEYLVKEPRDYFTQGSPFTTPGGFLHIEMQFNVRTNLIKQNQRFLFGNPGHWTCYKVIGTGINDFRNQTTYDMATAKVLSLDLISNFVNAETDDVVNGIADVNTNVYTITLNHTTYEGVPAEEVQMDATVTYNGDTVVRFIDWSTSDDNIASVDEDGVVTLRAIGTCIITGAVKGNPSNDTCSISVTNTPVQNAIAVLTPDKNYILEGAYQEFSVYTYINGVQQAESFTITCNPNLVPLSSYTFEQTDSNHFKVTNNLRDVNSYLTIVCTGASVTRSFDIYLRGGWLFGNA